MLRNTPVSIREAHNTFEKYALHRTQTHELGRMEFFKSELKNCILFLISDFLDSSLDTEAADRISLTLCLVYLHYIYQLFFLLFVRSYHMDRNWDIIYVNI